MGSQETSARSRVPAADAALLGVAAIWGVTFPVIQEAIEGISTLSFLQLRFLAATLLILPVALLRGDRREVFAVRALVPGLLLAAGYLFQTVGLRTTSPSVSAFLTSTSVVMVPFLSRIFGQERTTPRRAAAVCVALLGVVLLQGGRLPTRWSPGETWTLLCAVAFAVQIVWIGRISPGRDPLSITAGQIAYATLGLFALGWVTEEKALEGPWTPYAWIAALFTGVFATAVAFFVQTWAQRRIPAGHVAVLFATEPVFAAFFSVLFYGDRLPLAGWIGAAAVLAATLLVTSEPNGGADRRSRARSGAG